MAGRSEVWWPLPRRWLSHRVGALTGSTQGCPDWQVASYSHHEPGMALGQPPWLPPPSHPGEQRGGQPQPLTKTRSQLWLGPRGVEGHSHSDRGGDRLPASIASGSHASGATGAWETCCAAGSAALLAAVVLRAVRRAHGVGVPGRAGFSSSAASVEDS